MQKVNQFRSFFKRHAFVGSIVVYSGLYSSGDLVRQTIQCVPQKDYVNSGRMGVVGGCLLAPIFYGWYKVLDSAIVGTTLKVVAKKVFVDQAIAGTSGVCLFYLGMSILERKKNVFADLKEKGPKTYMTGCVFWPIVQLVNFRFAPPHTRTAFVACAGFIWCIILSYIKSVESLKSDAISKTVVKRPLSISAVPLTTLDNDSLSQLTTSI